MLPWFHRPPHTAGASAAPVLLVVGAHRDERAFGEQVAARLNPARFAVLRIVAGLRGARPRPDQLPRYRREHAELYRQIAGYIRPTHRLLLDLHAGIHESGRCADVLCADPALLTGVQAHLANPTAALLRGRVRTIHLVADTRGAIDPRQRPGADPTAPWAIARPEIPASLWAAAVPRYVGLEVYLQTEGAGQAADWLFAQALIETVVACALAGR